MFRDVVGLSYTEQGVGLSGFVAPSNSMILEFGDNRVPFACHSLPY